MRIWVATCRIFGARCGQRTRIPKELVQLASQLGLDPYGRTPCPPWALHSKRLAEGSTHSAALGAAARASYGVRPYGLPTVVAAKAASTVLYQVL